MNIIHKLESFEIMGACFEVYKEKGSGFVESVYQECLEVELGDQEIPFRAQPPLSLTYKGRPLKSKFIPDFICYENRSRIKGGIRPDRRTPSPGSKLPPRNETQARLVG